MKFSLKTDTMDIWIKIWNLFFPVNGKPGGEMKKIFIYFFTKKL